MIHWITNLQSSTRVRANHVASSRMKRMEQGVEQTIVTPMGLYSTAKLKPLMVLQLCKEHGKEQ